MSWTLLVGVEFVYVCELTRNIMNSDVCETKLFTDYNGKKSSVYLVHRGMLDRKWVWNSHFMSTS